MLLYQLPDLIDWPLVMAQPRYAGGHQAVMETIFGSNARVIAEHIDDDYQGTLAYAYEFGDGTVVILTDYFGSCSGCDAWEDASDSDARTLIQSMVHSARLFHNGVRGAYDYCTTVEDEAGEYPFHTASNLTVQLATILLNYVGICPRCGEMSIHIYEQGPAVCQPCLAQLQAVGEP